MSHSPSKLLVFDCIWKRNVFLELTILPECYHMLNGITGKQETSSQDSSATEDHRNVSIDKQTRAF